MYIFSLPFSKLLWVERNGFIVLLVLLLSWCVINKRHFFLKTPIDLPLFAFIGWVGISVPFAFDPLYSFKEFAKLLQHAIIFYSVFYFFREGFHQRRLIGLLVVAFGIISLYGILQFETGPWRGPGHPESRSYYLIESFTPGEVWLTTYLVMLMPLGLAMGVFGKSQWQIYLGWGVVFLGVTCQILTFSRAGMLSMMVEGVVFSRFVSSKRTKIILGFLGLVIVVSAVLGLIIFSMSPDLLKFVPGQAKFSSRNLEARFHTWDFALEKTMENPLVGIGFGKDNFQTATGEEFLEKAKRLGLIFAGGTHNTFVDFMVGSGIPALLLFLLLIGRIIYAALKIVKEEKEFLRTLVAAALITSVAGTCVRLSFDHMLIGTLAVQFWVIVALGLNVASSRTQDQMP